MRYPIPQTSIKPASLMSLVSLSSARFVKDVGQVRAHMRGFRHFMHIPPRAVPLCTEDAVILSILYELKTVRSSRCTTVF